MQRILISLIFAGAVALFGCTGCKEQRARYRANLKANRKQTGQTNVPPAQQTYRGLDLTSAPRTTDVSALPDLWEEVPIGSASFEVRKGVVGYGEIAGAVYHVPEKDCFYVQCDPPGSSRHTYFGPFAGDPAELLKLEKKPATEDGPANESQPSRSETNRTSSAAGSRR